MCTDPQQWSRASASSFTSNVMGAYDISESIGADFLD
jgi:hypothetical protein